ncbi:MAG: transcriptional regulator [Actinomycetota bacterium]|nr:transcriptional regulator [Actinomycetota bacterium]
MTAESYNRAVGSRLRAIRKQKGYSLQEVEAISNQEFKASVLGAYERGERSLSLPRLQRLGGFYGVPVDQMLPQQEARPGPSVSVQTGGVRIDLNRLESSTGPEVDMLEKFLRAIQMMRQDFNGRVLTIRNDDLRLLSVLLEANTQELADRLGELGLTTTSTE